MWTSSVVVVLFSTQTLTTPHSPDWWAGSDECCPSSETPALLNPLRMAGSSPVALRSLEHKKRVLKTQVWFGLVWFGLSFPSGSYLWVQALSVALSHNSSLWGWLSWRWRTRVCLLRVSVQVKPGCSGRSTRPERVQDDPAAAGPEPLCPHLRSLSPSLRTDACSRREVSWSTRPRRTRSLRGESHILPETLNPRVWASLGVRLDPEPCVYTQRADFRVLLFCR